jgi:hypothetical protein
MTDQQVIAGILLGPTLFHGKITATLFPITLRPPLSALANLGVVMFMFAVGYLRRSPDGPGGYPGGQRPPGPVGPGSGQEQAHRAALTDEAAPPRRPRDLQRSPVVCRLSGEDTGTKVMLSGTPRRGVAEWSSGISESQPIRTRLLIRR